MSQKTLEVPTAAPASSSGDRTAVNTPGKPAEVPASAFFDGSVLADMVQHNAHRMRSVVKGALAPDTVITVGTICSGSEVVVMCLLLIMLHYQEMGVNLKFVYSFGCELKTGVQNWIMQLIAELQRNHSLFVADPGCLFARAEDMGNPTALCVKHGRLCAVPHVDMIIAGTSCKDFSRAGGQGNSVSSVLTQPTTPGGSAQQFYGLMGYLQIHAISILLLENVDTLEDTGKEATDATRTLVTPLRQMLQKISAYGLQCHSFLTDAVIFGMPTHRRRYYLVGLRAAASPLYTVGAGGLSEVFAKMSRLVAMCERTAPCVSAVLLPAGHPAVEEELNRRTEQGRRGGDYNVGTSISQFSGLGLTWGSAAVPEHILQSPWYDTLTGSQKTALTYSFAERPDAVTMRDISQSLCRLRHSSMADHREIAFCQLPVQIVWLNRHGEPSMLLGREAMTIQGFPLALVPMTVNATSEHQMMSLAGNMMASAIPLALVQALLAAVPWTSTSGAASVHTNSDDIDAAMRLFTNVSDNHLDSDDDMPNPPKRIRLRRQAPIVPGRPWM